MKKLYAEISKTEAQDDGTIRVWGYASSEAVDSDGETITADAMKAAIPDYMKFGAVREMHQPLAAGTAIECKVEDDGRTFFGAHIVDPVAVKKVQAGVYKAFSIGGKVTERDDLNKTIIKGLKLVEVSLVDRPANPEAVMTCFKAESTDSIDTTEETVEKADEIEQISAVDKLADMLNKGEITAERLVELAKQADKPADPVLEEVAKTEETTLEKGLWDVADFAQLLNSLGYIVSSAEWETQYEGDNSPIPAALRGWLAQGVEIFKAMAAEETAEMLASLQAMVPQPVAVTVIEQADQAGDIAKAGAKFSAVTKDTLAAIHKAARECCDHLDALGYEKADDKEDAEAIDDLGKVSGELDLAKADLAKIAAERDDLQKRVKELEALPAPGKALLKAISKGQDVTDESEQKEEPVAKVADGTHNEDAALAQIRKMYKFGGQAKA